MSRSGAEIKESENQSKFIHDRITAVEKHFGQMCETFSSYTRKTARLRDKGDQISKDLVTYVDGETLNPSSKKCFTEFAHNLAAIQDYRNAQVTRLESKVQQPLSNYGLKCKHTKADLKAAFAAREKEQKILKKLTLARSKGDFRQVSTLETDLQKASIDASRTTKNLELQADKFELEKLQDAKKILTDFVTIEMAFHAKALEMYSQCYQTLNAIDIDQDIWEFRAKMKPSNSTVRMNVARSGSVSTLDSTVHEDTPRAERPATQVQNSPARSVTNGIVKTLDNDDEEEEDDDEDDDEEEDSEEESEEEETEAETDRNHVQATRPGLRR